MYDGEGDRIGEEALLTGLRVERFGQLAIPAARDRHLRVELYNGKAARAVLVFLHHAFGAIRVGQDDDTVHGREV